MWVKPAPGTRYRDHRTRALWEDDAAVEIPDFDMTFQQRINHGDLVVCDEDGNVPEPEPEPKAAAGKTAKAPPAPQAAQQPAAKPEGA